MPDKLRDTYGIYPDKQARYPERDRIRHEKMRLRGVPYGVPKILLKGDKIFPGTCEACVFGRGEHICASS